VQLIRQEFDQVLAEKLQHPTTAEISLNSISDSCSNSHTEVALAIVTDMLLESPQYNL